MRNLLFLFAVAQLSLQQKDPLNDFCRRFGHQSAVVDNKLYLDGGLVNWNPISQSPQNFSNSWLLYNDLSTSPANSGVPQLYANASKNATIPSVSGGILWADDVNKRFYLYGGDYYGGITPGSLNLLSYDTIYNQWESFGAPNMPISTVSWGGGVSISELGQGYVLGGWLSNSSVPGWMGVPYATSTLIKYQMDGSVWTNNTGPDTSGRAEGSMVYIPASGTGILVYFGGIVTPYGNGTILPSSMSMIYIYDIASSKWYSQVATGDIPANRKRFCAGAATSPDHSSYNIYLYGGLGFEVNATGFDDVYILSLPSFQWIKWWEGSPPGNPHHSLTCNVINEGQMLIIGGTFPLSDSCDSPPTWGTHNLDLGKQSGKMWNDFQVNLTSYIVPPEIVAVVGGSSMGGATATAPASGFNNHDLSVYFAEKASVATRTPTRAIPTPTNPTIPTQTTPPKKKKVLSSGAIAGIAVGGTLVLLAFLALGCCLIRRHKRTKDSAPPTNGNGSVNYPHMAQSLNSQFSHPEPQPPSFQLQGMPIPQPAELSGNNYHDNYQNGQQQSKLDTMQQSNHRDHPAFWQQVNPSPTAISPLPAGYSPVPDTNTNTMSPTNTSIAPVPSYSSSGGTARIPVLRNQTYYSP